MNNTYFNQLKKGDIATLAQSITLIESSLDGDEKKANDLIDKCLEENKQKTFRICISGSPGVGKSTFINSLLEHLSKLNKKIAVLAIDPSSNKSKGSILADKTRMHNFSQNENIFIRPSPSKGKLGGVSNKTRQSIILCEAAGFEIIIIETTGVGQTEIKAKEMTDYFVLLTMPNSGDYLQGLKKGIVEISDLIVINKVDTITKLEILKEKSHYKYSSAEKTKNNQKIEICSAIKNIGIKSICKLLIKYYEIKQKNGDLQKKRFLQLEYWLHESIKEKLIEKFYKQKNIQKEIRESIVKMEKKNINMDKLSKQIIQKYLK